MVKLLQNVYFMFSIFFESFHLWTESEFLSIISSSTSTIFQSYSNGSIFRNKDYATWCPHGKEITLAQKKMYKLLKLFCSFQLQFIYNYFGSFTLKFLKVIREEIKVTLVPQRYYPKIRVIRTNFYSVESFLLKRSGDSALRN